MNEKTNVFDQTYAAYLKELAQIDLLARADVLGADVAGKELILPFYGEPYQISAAGIRDQKGTQANFAVCVVLCKYILLCPEHMPVDGKWVTYREFKDAGPLTVYFANNTNKIIETSFPDSFEAFARACQGLGGRPFDDDSSHDASMVFNALPRIPVLLRLNFRDADFPAQCTVLFRQSAEAFLDMESLAIVGTFLAGNLIRFNTPGSNSQ